MSLNSLSLASLSKKFGHLGFSGNAPVSSRAHFSPLSLELQVRVRRVTNIYNCLSGMTVLTKNEGLRQLGSGE